MKNFVKFVKKFSVFGRKTEKSGEKYEISVQNTKKFLWTEAQR